MKIRFLMDDETDPETPFAYFLEADFWAAADDSRQQDFEAKMHSIPRSRQTEFAAWLAERGVVPTFQKVEFDVPDDVVFEIMNGWRFAR